MDNLERGMWRGKSGDEWIVGWRTGETHVRDIRDNVICSVDPSTLGEYTGIQDKNGEPIFEGDKLHIEIHNNSRLNNVIASGTEEVIYKNCSYGVIWGFHRDFTRFDGFCYTTFEIVRG